MSRREPGNSGVRNDGDDLLAPLRSPFSGWPPALLTVSALGAAAVARLLLDQSWSHDFPFVPFFPAVFLCALVAGWKWGSIAAIASAALVVVLSPAAFASAGMVPAVSIYLMANAFVIALAESALHARRRAEDEAARARDSERRFNVMADSVPLLIWVHDAKGRMQFVNRGWEAFFGVTQDQIRRDNWQVLVHEDDRAAYTESFLESLRLKTPFSATARVRRADGEWRWIESHGVPRLGPRGELLSFAGTSYDVTDRQALETEREILLESERAARTEAEHATRAKDEFLATLSHELRTPLSIIVLWSRILARKYGDGEDDLRKGLALVIDNGMALSQLIGDLLDMSRIVSGRVSLDLRALDASELLTQAVASHRPAAEAKRIQISLDSGSQSEPTIVLGDPTRLQQVVWNLLANAVKFTPENGHVWVTLERCDGSLRISVRDDGEGMAPEFLTQVFSRFRQADSSSARRHGGLGLGLAIVKQLVELHGGQVRVSSPGLGEGSTFVVELPLHESEFVDHADSSGTWKRLDPDRLVSLRLDGRHVLAVEDQPDMLESLRQNLEERGAVVTAVGSGVEALELLRNPAQSFDALVSDLGMPRMDGYELIRRIRSELGLTPQSLPALAVTAYARDEDRARALQAGFQAHLSKPYQVGQLIAVLNQLPSTARAAGSTVAVRQEAGASMAM